MIRPATAVDVHRIVQMGRKFHAYADLGGEFVPDDFADFCQGLIDMAQGVIFVSPNGMIGGYREGMMWNRAHVVAYEVFWWAEDGFGDDLRKAFEAWAGSAPKRMSALYGKRSEAIARLLKRDGYMPAETPMVKA